MAEHNFRIALHGFHREDVVHFIEESTLAHEQALREKDELISRLKLELEEKNAQLSEALEQVEQLRANPPVPQELEEVLPPVEQASQAQAPAAPELDAPIAPVPQEAVMVDNSPSISDMELAAYRRAEMTERMARDRAASVYTQIRSVFDQSNAKIANSNQDLETLADALRLDLTKIQAALETLKGVYVEASDAFRSVGESNLEVE